MKMVFKLPAGVEIPDGKEEGDTFQAMATFKLMDKGEVELTEVDNEPIDGKEPEDTTDEGADDDSTQSGPSLQDRLMGSMANSAPAGS
jgi:hypothetical protein